MAPISESSLSLSWLDEELRKEKALLADLREAVDKQQISLTDQTQRLLAFEDRLTKLEAQLMRISGVEEALQHTRDEIVLLIAELRQEGQKREAEFWRNRQAERAKDMQAIQEVKQGLERLRDIEQALASRQAGEEKLNGAVLQLRQTIEELAKQLQQDEEKQRHFQDGLDRHKAEMERIEAALGELQKAQQESFSRLLVVEDALAKLEQHVNELLNMRREITAQQEEFLETQRRLETERAQRMTEWGRKLESYAHQLEVWSDQLQFFMDQHEKNRRVLRDVQELAQEVSQQQDRLRQLQRIAEEQLRREMREWRSEMERRWAQERERAEKAWADQLGRERQQEERFETMEGLIKQNQQELQALRAELKELVRGFTEEFARWKAWQGQGWKAIQDVSGKMLTGFQTLEKGDKEG
ncbi:MAG: hypothetical protein J7M05_03550 [Anaerolineae bacterium]|nr:hypothetical protein [Anaerolineae bacterium]